MTVNLSDKGLREIVNSFDLFYIDIWGSSITESNLMKML